MANRTFIDSNFSLVKRMVHLFCDISVSEAVTPVPTLQKWNYPTLGVGGMTYSAAPTASALPSGAGPYPLQYGAGSEGVLSIARTAVGKYTLKLQDNYQRLVGLYGFQSNSGGVATWVALAEDTAITSMAPTSPGSIIGMKFSSSAGNAVDPIGHQRLTLILLDATEP